MSLYKFRPQIAALLLAVLATGCAVPSVAVSASVPPASSEAIVQRTEPLPQPTEEELQQSLEGKLSPAPLLLSAGVHKHAVDQKAEADKLAAEEAAAKKAAAEKKAAEEAAAKKAAADKKAAEEAAQKEQSGSSESEAPDGETTDEKNTEGDTVEGETPEGDLPATGSSGSSSLVKNGKIAVSDLRAVANEPHYNITQAFLDDVSGRDSLSVSEFKSLAASHGLSQKYVQRFVDDAFVYKMGNSYTYTPVDYSLRMNNYNFDNLTHGSYKDYVVNGQSRAEIVIDVSYAQGDINWNSVKSAGINKAYIRLGRRAGVTGLLGLDDKFHQNMRNAQAAGVQVGVYFYTQAINNAEAREEANFVLDALSGYTLDLPVVFDIEGGENANFRGYGIGVQTATNVCKTFLDTVKNAGYKVMLYSYAKYATEHLDLSQLQQYDFWLAQYYDVPFFPYNFKMWQYTGSGSVPGIKGGVDMNLLFHDYRR